MRTEQFSVETVAEALRASAGIYTLAATKLKCGRQTIADYVGRHPELAELCRAVVEENIDIAETELLKLIRSGNLGAVIYYLKTKGKHRGYVERFEATGKDGAPLVPAVNLSAWKTDDLRQLRELFERNQPAVA